MSERYKMYKKAQKKAMADEREAKTGMRQSFGAMIAKIAFGIIFIITCFDNPEVSGLSNKLVGIVLGLALIAWGLLPYLNARKKKEQEDLERILNAPLPRFDDGVEDLAKKYEDK